jgi:hypothetical protein
MTARYPNLIYSDFSGRFDQDGFSVELSIMKLEGSPEWTLEVINSAGKSFVWEEGFENDKDAYIEFLQTLAEYGIYFFVYQGTVIQFPWR